MNGEKVEVAIKDGAILAVEAEIESPSKEVLDLEGKHYLSAGWVDDHVHCYEK